MRKYILDVSRIDGKSLELRNNVFDLVATINGLLDDYRNDRESLARRCEVSFDCKFKNALVFGDRQRILQVVQNLLENALNFTKHGSITLSLLEKIKNANAKEWNIVIKDEGEGIRFRDNTQIIYQICNEIRTRDRIRFVYFKKYC